MTQSSRKKIYCSPGWPSVPVVKGDLGLLIFLSLPQNAGITVVTYVGQALYQLSYISGHIYPLWGLTSVSWYILVIHCYYMQVVFYCTEIQGLASLPPWWRLGLFSALASLTKATSKTLYNPVCRLIFPFLLSKNLQDFWIMWVCVCYTHTYMNTKAKGGSV